MITRARATFHGALAGGFLALVSLAFWTSRTSLASVVGVESADEGVAGRAEFVVSSGGLYAAVIIASVIGGLAIAAVVHATVRESVSDRRVIPIGYVFPAAAVLSAAGGYVAARSGLAALADIDAGVVTVSVFRLAIVVLIAGAVAGAVSAGGVHAFASPEFLRLGGEAWPSSGSAAMGEMMRAVGGPTMGAVVVAAIAIGLALLLLELEGALAVAAFGIVAAMVLFGAALLAYRPWDRAERS
ncbi:MAG: hypothetical protein ACE5GC_03420 [Acidimicrobiia bacterium]